MAGYGGKGGFGGGMNMQQMMKQAQKLQEQMAKAQAELEETEVEGKAGGGIVTVTMNGKKRVTALSVRPEAVDPDDIEMLEDLLLAAYNDAWAAAEALEQEKLPMGGGMLG